MTALVVFVEEESARIVVETVLKKVAPSKYFTVIQHEGKSDLLKSFPRKIRAWRYPSDVPFIILRDNDGADCSALKIQLLEAVPSTHRDRTRIRLVIHCLEGWYLGDPVALEAAELINSNRRYEMMRGAKFKNPDKLTNAKQEFQRLHDERGQLALATRIAPHLSVNGNRSASFNLFIRTVHDFVGKN